MSRGKTAKKKIWATIEWPTVLLILACYAAWFAIGLLLWPIYPATSLLLLGVVLALQSSLMHEASHGHPTRSAAINEWLVGLPVGLVYPFRRFRTLHLRHHADERLTDPFDDPESYYQSMWHHERLPKPLRALLKVNNTMAGRFVLGPWLGSAGFVGADVQLMSQGDPAVRKAWIIHAVSLLPVLAIVAFVFGMPLWLYLLGRLARPVDDPDPHLCRTSMVGAAGRTHDHRRALAASVLFLNNNLHLVHHKTPNVAWYRLPKMFRARRDEWMA